MKQKLLIEKMPRRHCTLPTREWRVVLRECTRRGFSSDHFQVLEQNLTRSKASHAFRMIRRVEQAHG